MALQIQDSLTGEKRPFDPLEPGKVRMYVCGVTPYDHSHIGHARCYVAFDVVYRYLVYLGYAVTYVRNFTDIDDKIINRANERGVDPLALAGEFITSYHADMDALGVARPQHEPRVSTSIPEIIALISRLEANGLAYAVDGDVYFAIQDFPPYGALSKRSLDQMEAGRRVEVDERKRHPMDFALWKAAKPGEPKWDSPWGPGRPGWHIECSAMSMTSLGETIDLHGGGRDLIFPHHENEIAQSHGATGHPPVRYWLHNGFVTLDKEKMSKSLGNFFTISDLLERYEPQVLRAFLIGSSHYRNPISFSDALLDETAGRLAYYYETLRKTRLFLADEAAPFAGPLPGAAIIENAEERFREALDDDFSAVRAMDPLNDVFRTLNELIGVRKKQRAAAYTAVGKLMAIVERMDGVFNLFGEEPEAYLDRHRRKAAARRGVEVSWIEQRISARTAARTARDWAQADVVRDELQAAGVVLMDGPAGTDWMVADVRDEDGERFT